MATPLTWSGYVRSRSSHRIPDGDTFSFDALLHFLTSRQLVEAEDAITFKLTARGYSFHRWLAISGATENKIL